MKLLYLSVILVHWSSLAWGQETPVSFAQAINMAVSASPQRAAAEDDVAADDARRKEALAGAGPRVRADYNDVHFDKAIQVPFIGQSLTVRPDTYREGSVTVTQPLTGIYTAVEKSALARLDRDGNQMVLDQAKADAAFRAAEDYRRAQEATEMVRIAEASIAATDGQMHDAESLAQSGRLIRSDLLKLTIAQQEAKTQRARALATQKKSLASLRYDLGLAPEAPLTLEAMPAADTANVDNALTFTSVSATLENALQHRVEVKQAALGVEKAVYATRLARYRFAPSIDLFMKWDHIYSPPTFGTSDFTRSYGLTATWEIWDNGAKIFAAEQVAALSHKAELALTESKDRLRLEVQAVLADLEAAEQALDSAQASVAQSEEAYRLDKARFANGLVTATDLLLAEAGQTRARGALVSARTSLEVLRLHLQKVTGSTRPIAT